MADTLGARGKKAGMDGIKAEISEIAILEENLLIILSQGSAGASFTVAGDGTLYNSSAISWTIGPSEVGKEVWTVQLNSATSPYLLMRIDLETPVALTTEGTVTFPAGTVSTASITATL